MRAVRALREVRVYSPTEANRRRFAEEMAPLAGVEITPVDDPREVVPNADIVVTATNASRPVLDGQWLEPGTHLSTVVGGDYFMNRDEIDETAYRRADLFVVNSKEQITLDRQGFLFGLIERGEIPAETVRELADLVTGKAPPRTNSHQISLFKNNTGMGIQFAVTARLIYEKAKAAGFGRELPAELFITRREGAYSP
jgi:ornithine cyclodeaminase/alanine dehydrogenase-like protein (mu-crystallin family)